MYLSTTSLFLFSAMLCICSLFMFIFNKTIIISWELFTFVSSMFSLPIIMDPSSMIFSATVMFISANVLMFSSSYMAYEQFKSRFTHLVLLFIISMNLLIFIPNFITLLLGWDGLGLVSFLLVIYYQNNKSLAAGMLTALTNRIGDVLILISIAWTMSQGHWQMLNMWETLISMPTIMIILIMLAGMTKSAQIPFSAWLPAAMAAPTPVSALVHSSTLVTAGVFLIFRFYYFLASLPWFNLLLTLFGASTMLMAGTVAMTESDMKKIIALSTLSQLGVMMMTLGLNFPTLAFFHLITHALFKALLFICAGTIINLNLHTQDLRESGSLIKQLPTLMSAMFIANTALCGVPFMAGFYSKDFIIESALFLNYNMSLWFILLLATMLTAMYSSRFMSMLSFTPPTTLPLSNFNDKDPLSTTPSFLLALGAISAGITMNWLLIYPIMEPTLNNMNKMSASMVTLTGVILVLLTMTLPSPLALSMMLKSKKIALLVSTMWFLVPSSTQLLLPTSYKFSSLALKSLDQGWFEFFGPQNIFSLTINISTLILSLQKMMFHGLLFIAMFFNVMTFILY